jgi:hypothetical protein
MNWVAVESSVFEAAAYLQSNRLLYLKFRSGDIYRYFDFPAEEYTEFLSAESKGRYFAERIRDRYRYKQIPQATASGI